MSFKDLSHEPQTELLQRSLERGRLGHAYLLEGEDMETLETAARTLAKTLNCLKPARSGAQKLPVDCCDTCLPCRHTDSGMHPDVHWLRPESKLRVIRADQVRDLLGVIHLKPNEGGYKLAVLAGADRMNTQAANIFLKTLEEPPPRSVLLLLTTEPQRLLETIVSRCLRLRFGTGAALAIRAEDRAWLEAFSQMAASEENSLIGRYRLLCLLLKRLAEKKANLERDLEERSPLNHHEEVEKSLKEKWESELSAAVESEYRHQRIGLLRLLQHWLRDLWLRTLQADAELLQFKDFPGMREVAGRINARQALENLTVLEQAQRLLHTNVQEALALEVCLLKLRL